MEHRSSTGARHLTLFWAVLFTSIVLTVYFPIFTHIFSDSNFIGGLSVILCFACCSNLALTSFTHASTQQGAVAILVSLSVIIFFSSNLEDQGLFLVRTLPVNQSGMITPARDRRPSRDCSRPWDTQASPPLQGISPRWGDCFLRLFAYLEGIYLLFVCYFHVNTIYSGLIFIKCAAHNPAFILLFMIFLDRDKQGLI